MWPFRSKDYALFNLLAASANVVVRAGNIVKEVVEKYDQLDERLKQLTLLEDEGDRIIDELFQKLNQSFVLPFNREDAYSLVQKLDSILDYIAGVVDRIILYQAAQPNPVVSNMVEVLEKAIACQESALKSLADVESKREEIMNYCGEITSLEREQDALYRQGMSDLFEGQYDAMTVIKWKEIYEHLESTLDRCEEVGDLIRGICMKYS